MLSKNDLAQRIAQKSGLSTAKASQVMGTVFDSIAEALGQGEEVRLTGFGTFRVSERAERMARNPRTGESIRVPAGRRVSFSAGTRLTEAMRGEHRQAA